MTPQYKVTDFIGTSPLGPLYLRNTSIQGTKILVHECWHFYLCICYLFLKGHLHGVEGGGHSRDVWVEVCRQSLQNLRTLSKTNRPSIALFFFDNLQRYPEGNSLVKTLQLRKSPQCSGFFSRRHVSHQCDSREMILHYDKRENMIRAISDTDRTTSQDTQISCEIYMCVVEFFTNQKCLIWKEPFRWVNNSLLITVLIRISAQPRISVHLE